MDLFILEVSLNMYTFCSNLELGIKPNITVIPSTYVTEGDNITFSCSVNMTQQRNSELILSHGRTTLSSNMIHEDYAMLAKANDSGEYECISSLGGVHKSSSLNITVKGEKY